MINVLCKCNVLLLLLWTVLTAALDTVHRVYKFHNGHVQIIRFCVRFSSNRQYVHSWKHEHLASLGVCHTEATSHVLGELSLSQMGLKTLDLLK